MDIEKLFSLEEDINNINRGDHRSDFNRIKDFYEKMSNMKYLIYNNKKKKIINDPKNDDIFSIPYKVSSETEFKHNGGGTCIDFTVYENMIFKREFSKIKNKYLFFMPINNNGEGEKIHTSMIFELDNSTYLFEVLLDNLKGVMKYSSGKEAIKAVCENIAGPNTTVFVSYFSPDKVVGMTIDEFISHCLKTRTPDIDENKPDSKMVEEAGRKMIESKRMSKEDFGISIEGWFDDEKSYNKHRPEIESEIGKIIHLFIKFVNTPELKPKYEDVVGKLYKNEVMDYLDNIVTNKSYKRLYKDSIIFARIYFNLTKLTENVFKPENKEFKYKPDDKELQDMIKEVNNEGTFKYITLGYKGRGETPRAAVSNNRKSHTDWSCVELIFKMVSLTN